MAQEITIRLTSGGNADHYYDIYYRTATGDLVHYHNNLSWTEFSAGLVMTVPDGITSIEAKSFYFMCREYPNTVVYMPTVSPTPTPTPSVTPTPSPSTIYGSPITIYGPVASQAIMCHASQLPAIQIYLRDEGAVISLSGACGFQGGTGEGGIVFYSDINLTIPFNGNGNWFSTSENPTNPPDDRCEFTIMSNGTVGVFSTDFVCP